MGKHLFGLNESVPNLDTRASF